MYTSTQNLIKWARNWALLDFTSSHKSNFPRNEPHRILIHGTRFVSVLWQKWKKKFISFKIPWIKITFELFTSPQPKKWNIIYIMYDLFLKTRRKYTDSDATGFSRSHGKSIYRYRQETNYDLRCEKSENFQLSVPHFHSNPIFIWRMRHERENSTVGACWKRIHSTFIVSYYIILNLKPIFERETLDKTMERLERGKDWFVRFGPSLRKWTKANPKLAFSKYFASEASFKVLIFRVRRLFPSTRQDLINFRTSKLERIIRQLYIK